MLVSALISRRGSCKAAQSRGDCRNCMKKWLMMGYQATNAYISKHMHMLMKTRVLSPVITDLYHDSRHPFGWDKYETVHYSTPNCLEKCTLSYSWCIHAHTHTYARVAFKDAPCSTDSPVAAIVCEWTQSLAVSLGIDPAGGLQRHAGCHLRISITSRITEASKADYGPVTCNRTRLALMCRERFPRGLVSAVLKHACRLAPQ